MAIAAGAVLTEPVVQAIGPPPTTRGGQRVWCGLASEIERDRDRGLWRDPTDHAGRKGTFARMYDERRAYERSDDLIHFGAEADPVAATVVAEPGAWDGQLQDARAVMQLALRIERSGLDLGL